MKISPEQVIYIDGTTKFPLYIRNAWRVYKAEDPVAAAKKSIAELTKLRNRGVFILTSVGLLAITAAWFVLSRDYSVATWLILPLWQKASVIAGMLLGGISALLAVSMLTVPGAPDDYANKPDEFGWEFTSLLYLLGFDNRLSDFLKQPKEQALEIATKVLIEQAVEVLESEKMNAEHRMRRLEEGWKPNYAEDHARNLFRSDFDRVKKFGLTDPKGWGPYFEAAKARLANPQPDA